MIRKSNGDITDKEVEKILIPFGNNFNKYITNYIIPEVISFYIASAYFRNALWQTTFLQIYNSAADSINVFNEDKNKSMREVKKTLKIKYSLEIINDNPLEIKEIKY